MVAWLTAPVPFISIFIDINSKEVNSFVSRWYSADIPLITRSYIAAASGQDTGGLIAGQMTGKQ